MTNLCAVHLLGQMSALMAPQEPVGRVRQAGPKKVRPKASRIGKLARKINRRNEFR